MGIFVQRLLRGNTWLHLNRHCIKLLFFARLSWKLLNVASQRAIFNPTFVKADHFQSTLWLQPSLSTLITSSSTSFVSPRSSKCHPLVVLSTTSSKRSPKPNWSFLSHTGKTLPKRSAWILLPSVLGFGLNMFRRVSSSLPKDPVFPIDLDELG